jgi:hypothetical protein
MPRDKIEIEILEDGSLRIITGKISMANHRDADDIRDLLTTSAGGESTTVSTTKGKPTKPHTHTHDDKLTHSH